MIAISLNDLNALQLLVPFSADTGDAKTPECFIRMSGSQSIEAAGNDGSVLLVTGRARVDFVGGAFAVLDEEVFQCRTPVDYRLTAETDSIVKVLGRYEKRKVEIKERTVQLSGARIAKADEEAYYAMGDFFAIGERQMAFLRSEVVKTNRQRTRICAHKNTNAKLHEMFVCYTKTANVHPHKHLAKDESFHVLEGKLDFIMYNGTGDVVEIIPMGDKDSGKPFYVRVPMDTFHTVVMTSDFCILHEGTPGPFDRMHTHWATWAKGVK